MTRWWWVRHAPVDAPDMPADFIYGDQDLPADCSDMSAIAELSRRLPATAVWLSSGLKRSRQTAMALAACRPQQITVAGESGLDEMHFGRWQGSTWSALYDSTEQPAIEAFWRDPIAEGPPQGESLPAVEQRVGAVIEAYTQRHTGQDLIAVAHAGTIRAALRYALGLDHAVFRLSVDCLHVSRLDHFGAYWQAKFINLPPAG